MGKRPRLLPNKENEKGLEMHGQLIACVCMHVHILYGHDHDEVFL